MMEMTYQTPMVMPASFSVIGAEEMVYLDGGDWSASNLGSNIAIVTLVAAAASVLGYAWQLSQQGYTLGDVISDFWGDKTPGQRVFYVVAGASIVYTLGAISLGGLF